MKNDERRIIFIIYCFLIVWIYVIFAGITAGAAEQATARITNSKNAVENRTPPNPGLQAPLSNTGSDGKVRIYQNSAGVVLSWQPVTLDVNGQPEDLAGYEILRANTAYFRPSYDFLMATSTGSNFLDDRSAAGEEEWPSFYYVIRARDWWGNISLPSNRVGATVLPLQSGWNLVAFPLDQDNFSLAWALGRQIDGADTPEQSAMICSFDVEHQQFRASWLHATQSEWRGEVQGLERGQGYFIKIPQNDPLALTLSGYVPEAPIAVKIRPGWNLVGNPIPATVSLQQSGLVPSGFAGAPGRTNSDQIYQLQGNDYRQAWFNSATQSWEGDFDQFEIGAGFWIYRQVNRGDFDWVCPIPEAK